AEVFGDEASGLVWHPATTKTLVVSDTPGRRILEDSDDIRWGNGRLEFTFGLSAKYYEGQPRLFTEFVLSLIKPTVVGFGLSGTEKPGQPIVRVTFERAFITDEQAAALRKLFRSLLRPDKPPREKKRRN